MMGTARLMLATAVVAAASASAAKPNLFFVMVDDWGHCEFNHTNTDPTSLPLQPALACLAVRSWELP